MTRVIVHADSGNRPRFHLPWNYHLSLQSFVYDAVGKYEPELASELHQLKHAPPFSFSEFIQTGPFQTDDDGINFERGYLVFSTPDDRIANSIANFARADNELTVGHTTIPVVGVEADSVSSESGRDTFKTLSPIASSKTDEDRTWIMPDDSMWRTRIRNNVRDRIEYTQGLHDGFEFRVPHIDWVEKKWLRVSSEYNVPCARMEFDVVADAETKKFFELNGIGEKTGMGFGSVMRTEDIPSWWS